MSSCPGVDQLRRLLDESLPDADRVELDFHVGGCASCQTVLDQLTGEVDWSWSSARSEPGSTFSTLCRSRNTGTLPEIEPARRSSGLPHIPGYEILSPLGHGGMGVVYKARQRGLDRLVALKMIRGGLHAGPEHHARFQIEAWAVARLRHPHVVQIHEVGEAEGLPFVALELLEGGSLEARIGGTPLAEAQAADLLIQLAEGVAAAHAAGVVHRDLKSSNILFAADDTPKITDFGLAKRVDEQDGQTQTGQVMGSPSFMAPEQANGQARRVGPAADVYSLGAILYEMLTGRPPFKGASPMETLLQVINDDPVPPSRMRSGLSRDLETICLKCLAKEPARRYATAADLALDLRLFRAGATIRARRTGLRERSLKWARRQPAQAALLGIVAVGIMVAAATFWADAQRRLAVAADAEACVFRAAPLVANNRTDEARSDINRLHELLPALGRDPAQARLYEQARRLVRECDDRHTERLRITQRDQRRSAFERGLTEALFLETQLPGDPDAVRRLRDQVHLALDAWDADTPTPSEAKASRHALLVFLARATEKVLPGEDRVVQARAALAILNEANNFHPATRSVLELRATCLDRLGDGPGSAEARALAETTARGGGVIASHELLIDGLDDFHKRRWSRALGQFQAAARDRHDPFWPQYLSALCRIRLGQFAAAQEDLTACLRSKPDRFWLVLQRGFALAEQGAGEPESDAARFLDAATDDYARASELAQGDDQTFALLVNQGLLAVRRGDLERADAEFGKAIATQPDRLEAYLNRAEVRRRRGDVAGALADCDRAIALRPGQPMLWARRAGLVEAGRSEGWLERAIADQTEAIRRACDGDDPRDRASDLVDRGRYLAVAGRLTESLADCDAALRLDPANARAHLTRVEGLLHLKRAEEAIRSCNAVLGEGDEANSRLGLTPGDRADLIFARGMAYEDRGDYPAAIRDYTRVLTIRPHSVAPLARRGWSYLVSEAYKLARPDFEEVLRIDPAHPDALVGRGQCRVVQGQVAEAIQDAEAAVQAGTTDARIVYNAARIYAQAATLTGAGRPDPAGPGRRPVTTQVVEGYQDRAHVLLKRAVEGLPREQRPEFWANVVQNDPALASIRRRAKFSQMAGQIGRPAR